MSKESLITLYEAWPDDRLLDEYVNKRKDYEVLALEAMSEVIQTKGLQEQAEEMLHAKSVSKENARMLEEQLYQQSEFGSVETDAEFAQNQKNSEGIYFKKVMMIGSKSNLFGFAIAMALIIILVSVVFVFTEKISSSYLVAAFALAGLFIYWGIQILKKNKVQLVLRDYRGKARIEIGLKDETVEFNAPLDYQAHARLVEVRNRTMVFKRPNLYILLRHPDGRKIMLHEDQPPTKSMPPNWHVITTFSEELNHDLRLTQHGTAKIELEKLKRLLDGLSDFN